MGADEQVIIVTRVREVIGRLGEAAGQLAHLGEIMGELSGTPVDASGVELQRVATGVQAITVQSMLAMCEAVMVVGRLIELAAAREA